MTRFARRKRHVALGALILTAAILLALTIALAPTPTIKLDYGETTISISADRA